MPGQAAILADGTVFINRDDADDGHVFYELTFQTATGAAILPCDL
jgi:hypothetical protein